MAKEIFRKEALQRLASPDQLDRLMQLTRPRAWIALASLGFLLLAAATWAVFGTIPTTVQGQGVLMRRGGVKSIRSPSQAVVAGVLVRVGQEVDKETELVRLSGPPPADAAAPTRLVSPCRARVLEVFVRDGEAAQAGAELLALEPLDEPLEAVLYVPVADAYKVPIGAKAAVAPAPVPENKYGRLVGEVQNASLYPATHEEMMRRLAHDDLVKVLSGAGPCLEIDVALTPAREASTGYRWSSSNGPPLELNSYTPCRALITVSEQRPIDLVLPTLNPSPGR